MLSIIFFVIENSIALAKLVSVSSLRIILPTVQISQLQFISKTDYFRYNFFLLHQMSVTQ